LQVVSVTAIDEGVKNGGLPVEVLTVHRGGQGRPAALYVRRVLRLDHACRHGDTQRHPGSDREVLVSKCFLT
jgi:hypothetical protein